MRPRDAARPSLSYSLRDVLDAYREFQRGRPDEAPRFVVVDPLTWLAVKCALDMNMAPRAEAANGGLWLVYGMTVVVIQSDGIPVLQVVGSPDHEADKHLRGATENAPKAPERSEA